jgi:nanoRNase/pAp phosphatase (c-di-AMP/oligoRNAs hydrolase)
LRSRCALDCALLAASCGGGGHKAAAGATFDCGLDEALAQMAAKTAEMYAALG